MALLIAGRQVAIWERACVGRSAARQLGVFGKDADDASSFSRTTAFHGKGHSPWDGEYLWPALDSHRPPAEALPLLAGSRSWQQHHSFAAHRRPAASGRQCASAAALWGVSAIDMPSSA